MRVRELTHPATTGLLVVCALIPPLSLVTWLPFLEYVTVPLVYAPQAALAEPWRLVTGGFVHANYWHLAMNALSLFIVGRTIEDAFGAVRTVVLWLVASTGSYVFLLALGVFTPWGGGITVGASGGIFAFFALVIILYRSSGLEVTGLTVMLGVLMAYSFLADGVSWEGHLGGILVGVALGVGFAWVKQVTRRAVAGVDPYDPVSAERARRARRRGVVLQNAVLVAAAIVEVAVWFGCLVALSV